MHFGSRAIPLVHAGLLAAIVAAALGVLASAALAVEFELPDSVATRRVGWRTQRFAGDGTSGPFPLGATFLFAGAESVVVNGRRLTLGTDYMLDANRGSILFTRAVAAGDTIAVAYRFLPFALPPSFGRWTPRPVGTPPESVIVASPAPEFGRSALETGGLRVGGSKSVALLVGSDRDLTLDQALRVSIEGELSEDVSVVARLSDENLPFTPEGSSARLEELDKVFVEIKTPRLGATLGDYEVNLAGGEFGSYRRVLKGALGRADLGRVAASASAGVSEGRFVSIELRGVEGLQGPYSIVDVGAQTVVAGSEEVFVDGSRLERGEDNDYVIDYSTGEIRFMSKRPVRTGTRIAVDFQVTGDEYKRKFVTAGVRGALAQLDTSRASVGATLLSESDDADDPQGLVLSEADRESLATFGDADALVSGATRDSLNGDYDLVDGRFVFAGRDSGDYSVVFTFLGGGRGRYKADLDPLTGDRIFVFDLVDSAGDYDAVRRLPRPVSQSVVVFDARGAPARGLSLAIEAARSRLDANTLSGAQDDDNGGGALTARADWKRGSVRRDGSGAGELALRARARRLGEGFATLSRVDEIHLDERWNTDGFARVLSPDSIESNRLSTSEDRGIAYREDLFEGEASYRPIEGLVTALETGVFSRRGLIDSDRGAARAEYASERFGRAAARAERIRSEGDAGPGRTDRLSASAARTLGSFSPALAISREDRRSGAPDSLAGSRRDRGSFALGATPLRALRLGGEFVLEEADLATAALGSSRDWYHANEQALTANVGTGSAYSVSSRYRRREVDYTGIVADPDVTNHLGRVELRHRTFDAGVSGEYDYDVSTFQASRRRRVLVELPENETGDYDSLGNFVPGSGRYRAAEIDLAAAPATDLSASARVVVEPSRWLGGARRDASGAGDGAAQDPASERSAWNEFLRGLRFESLARVTERSTTARKRRLLLLDPEAFQRDATTIRGETLVRQEASWRSRKTGAIVTARYGRADVEDNSVESANREELRRDALIRLRGNVAADVSAELEWEPRRSRQLLNASESSRLASDFVGGTGTYQPEPNLSAALSGRVGWERDARLDEKLTSIETALSTAATVMAKGRISARVATLQFVSERRGGSLASPLTSRRDGEEWRLSADYDLSRYLTASLLYSGDNRRSGGTRHLLKMEARALF
ncbi:MAG: hypothetical protein ACKVU1_07845 [bacterium]